MERITECTENVTTDTDTDSIASHEDFALRKRKTGDKSAATATLKAGEKALTKRDLTRLQRELVKKKPSEAHQLDKVDAPVPVSNPAPPPQPPPPPPPPPGDPSTSGPHAPCNGSVHVHHHGPGVEGQSPTSPCDCPANLHDRESPLVISQVFSVYL